MAVYPGSIPSAGSASAADTLAAAGHTALHNTDRDEIRAIATKVGTGSSTSTSTSVLTGTGAGTSSWAQVNLTTMVTGTLPVASGGTGTTTSTGSGSTVLSTSPTLTTPVINNPTLNVNTVSEFTGANGVTVDGLNIKDGKLNTNDSVVTANITDDAVTAAKIDGIDKSLLTTDSNPYKFGVYRNAALNTVNGALTIIFDTELFDTNNNFDTSNGRYTAPVAGFYQFNWGQIVNHGTNGATYTSLFKNGAEIKRTQEFPSVAAGNHTTSGSAFIQLAAGDYVSSVYFTNAVVGFIVGNEAYVWFNGFLVSRT